MITHISETRNNTTVALVEASGTSGGRQFGIFKNLRIVRYPADTEFRAINQKGVEVVASEEVDARNKGPRSHYSQTLQAMREQFELLPDVARARLNKAVPLAKKTTARVRL